MNKKIVIDNRSDLPLFEVFKEVLEFNEWYNRNRKIKEDFVILDNCTIFFTRKKRCDKYLVEEK